MNLLKRSELTKAEMKPICPECGVRPLWNHHDMPPHKHDCRIAQFIARVNLWNKAESA